MSQVSRMLLILQSDVHIFFSSRYPDDVSPCSLYLNEPHLFKVDLLRRFRTAGAINDLNPARFKVQLTQARPHRLVVGRREASS